MRGAVGARRMGAAGFGGDANAGAAPLGFGAQPEAALRFFGRVRIGADADAEVEASEEFIRETPFVLDSMRDRHGGTERRSKTAHRGMLD